MAQLGAAVRDIRRSAQRSWNLGALGRARTPGTDAVAHALRDLAKPPPPDEQRWIKLIEARRKRLNASTEELTATMYGAGNRKALRTQDQMLKGVEVRNTVGHFAKRASKSPFWCRMLLHLIRRVQPTACVEMGTAVGISASYQAAGLKMNGRGRLVTLDGASSLAAVASAGFAELGLDNAEVVVGRFSDTLPGVLAERRPVDYVFVDGHHDEQATWDYFELIVPYLASSSIVVFDDIRWSEGMERAWSRIARDPRIDAAVDLGPLGLCVIDGSTTRPRRFQIPLRPSEHPEDRVSR